MTGKLIDYAEIDVELKQSATVIVTGFLVNGSTATQVGQPVPYSSTGSDSGPDSGDGDNYRIRFPKSGTTTVNRLEFTIQNSVGGASLEGGADGTGSCDAADAAACGVFSLGGPDHLNTTDTLFHLVDADGVLGCTPGPNGNNSATQTTDGITTTIERQINADGSACVPIPYNQDSSTNTDLCNPDTTDFLQCIFLQKDLLDQNAQFFWTVQWAPEDGQYMETPTEFDFGSGFHPLELCRADGAAGGGLNGFPDLPANGDPWCVVNTATTLNVATGLVTVTEKYFGSGDPGGSRH